MLKVLNRRTLQFSFPEVHEDAVLEIEFMRTFRVPDDGRLNALPPGCAPFEVDYVEKYPSKVPAAWRKHEGLLLPMYQAEALWIDFVSLNGYPFAVKIGSGNQCAVTGDPWKPGLMQGEVADERGLITPLQNYLPIPDQPWLDGFNTGDNEVRQFVAARLGQGVTVEEQLTGKADVGGIQIQVYPLKADCWEGRSDDDIDVRFDMVCGSIPQGMGLAAGGRIEQTIEKDEHLLDEYDMLHSSRVFVHLVNSEDWHALTGRDMPRPPLTAEAYNALDLPWFEWYDEGQAVSGSSLLAKVKSVGELDKEIAEKDKKIPDPTNVVPLKAKAVKDGEW